MRKTKTTYRAAVRSLPEGKLRQHLAVLNADGDYDSAPVRRAALSPSDLPARGSADELEQDAGDVLATFDPPLEVGGRRIMRVYIANGGCDAGQDVAEDDRGALAPFAAARARGALVTTPRCASCKHTFTEHNPETLACAGCGERPCAFTHHLPRTGCDAARQERAMQGAAWQLRLALEPLEAIASKLGVRPRTVALLLRAYHRRRPKTDPVVELALDRERLGELAQVFAQHIEESTIKPESRGD